VLIFSCFVLSQKIELFIEQEIVAEILENCLDEVLPIQIVEETDDEDSAPMVKYDEITELEKKLAFQRVIDDLVTTAILDSVEWLQDNMSRHDKIMNDFIDEIFVLAAIEVSKRPEKENIQRLKDYCNEFRRDGKKESGNFFRRLRSTFTLNF
jgi:hypothetical protein